MNERILTADDVSVSFRRRGWRSTPFRALRDVSLHIDAGETLGLVGESGSGKTTLGRAILGLTPIDSGTITIDGHALDQGSRVEQSRRRQVIFQDPYTSLNPSMTVGTILAEPLVAAGRSRADSEAAIRSLMDRVGLPVDATRRMPREFSGGQRQRIAIARALALEPSLIVCDEPVSALDLTTQAKILELMIDIQEASGVAYLFITHDLSVVRAISHRVAVMRRGEIIETGTAEVMTSSPKHPYTRSLLLASPVQDPDEQAERRERRRAVVESSS